jgi:hypothetical protein
MSLASIEHLLFESLAQPAILFKHQDLSLKARWWNKQKDVTGSRDVEVKYRPVWGSAPKITLS